MSAKLFCTTAVMLNIPEGLLLYILLIGASGVFWSVSLLIISYTFSEVARFFLLPKWAHRGSKFCLRFSRLMSIVFPTPEELLAESIDIKWIVDPPT